MKIYSDLCDADLLVILKNDNEQAYEAIYKRYHSLLFIYAHKKLLDKKEAEDVVQDVLLKLWHNRQQLDERMSLPAYLYTAVRNKAFDIFAHQQVSEKYLASLADFNPAVANTDYLLRENQLKELIQREIDALPVRMREIFQLSRRDKLSNKEIAAYLDLSPHTVDTQIKRALRLLKKRLGYYFWLLYFIH
ncbi:RNA polymerase sigma-70 factor [Sphingobacterium humi]|uniref:RNA polymerase sigma-70 factor n=1 Tax=Sphingobacterium humi TaxID=1796905 RepID=A0A6N8KUN0_9SPHI|nr:RNA polymerase sigma-70 factor [Sphingobacterium humi]MVZ61065.1 RNA polymerase sigma-70 factor [Sphingobacterium humi]